MHTHVPRARSRRHLGMPERAGCAVPSVISRPKRQHLEIPSNLERISAESHSISDAPRRAAARSTQRLCRYTRRGDRSARRRKRSGPTGTARSKSTRAVPTRRRGSAGGGSGCRRAPSLGDSVGDAGPRHAWRRVASAPRAADTARASGSDGGAGGSPKRPDSCARSAPMSGRASSSESGVLGTRCERDAALFGVAVSAGASTTAPAPRTVLLSTVVLFRSDFPFWICVSSPPSIAAPRRRLRPGARCPRPAFVAR